MSVQPSRPVAPLPEDATKGERTRAEVLEAGYQLFIEKGYHGTSMRQIADRAGLALGGIYNYFGGKEDLFIAILRERHPITTIAPLLNQNAATSVEALLRDGARRIIAALGEDYGLLRLVFIEIVEFGGRHIPLLFENFFPQILALAERLAQSPGSFRAHSPLVILRAYFGAVFAYAVSDMFLAKTPVRENLGTLDDVVDMFLRGALAEPPSD